jgi:hypothetical protein
MYRHTAASQNFGDLESQISLHVEEHQQSKQSGEISSFTFTKTATQNTQETSIIKSGIV